MSSIVKCCFDSNEMPDVLESLAKKCTDPGCCCGCCSALRPRYKRLVDNIFPVVPQDGLVKANMEKLTYYSLSSPEKLDRIGEYLFQRAARDIYRRRNGFVIIAMEAMDQLLLACHAQTLNLFVESFLKMVQKLLESTDPQLEILATNSFVRFANIEEDTPSYHRRYDFFVSKFSAMCHSSDSDKETCKKLRLAGIRGLQAVVRKTVSDDLVENIWEQQHMDKIVPSLLFNMQGSLSQDSREDIGAGQDDQSMDPPVLAETCMRELIGRASFGHIRSVLRPVLKHFDLHKLWVPNQFAIHTFKIIMFSIQAQYSYTVVETLMAYLDENTKSSPKIRTSIADVLSKIIAIAAGESVGPSVLEIINSLLRHLQASVGHGQSRQHDERLYQEALINALGEFANHLPDYQKIEIMMFIMNKVHYPLPDSHTAADTLFQGILLRSLLKVGTKYQTIHLNTTFPVSFLHPLLRMSLAPDPEMRILVQKILHTLIDRHRNLEKISKPTANIKDLELTLEKSSRPDLIFINKHGPVIYDALYTSLQMESNTIENMEAVYTTLALLCIEVGSHETIVDLLHLVLGLQSLALNGVNLSTAQRFNLHAIVASLLILIPYVVNIAPLAEYAEKVVETRRSDAPHFLPEILVHYPADCEPAKKVPHVLVDQLAVCESLKACGMDPTRLQTGSPYGAGAPGPLSGGPGHHHRHSWVEAGARGSVVDIANGPQDVDSVSSSPGMPRIWMDSLLNIEPDVYRHHSWDCILTFPSLPDESFYKNPFYRHNKTPEEELTFESMKRVLTESNDNKKEEEAERRQQISETFRTAPFNELMRRTQPKHDILQNKLNEIFKSLSNNMDNVRSPTDQNKNSSIPVYEQHFPELFVY